MPRINLLPWREQQRVERKKAFGVGMFGAMIAAVAVAGVGWLLLNQMMEAQQDRNARLRDEIKILDKKNEEIASLEEQKQQYIARMEVIEKLQRSRPEIVHVFDTFTRIIPDGVYLTSLRQTGNNFRIQGVAQSGTRVSTFMSNIDDSEWLEYQGLEKVEATRTSGQSSNFILNAKQIDTQAASGGNSK
jgi:type IV pilus assembly protein PilN